GAWRTGQRRAHAPDCMAGVARRLGDRDAYAVVAWLALQPVPADPRPAPQRTELPDLPCGAAPGARQ
ncbi:MAG: cytochrome C, partial [Ottowia sp.]